MEGDLAGRYQGSHVLMDQHGQSRRVEVFWQGNGWFWRRVEGPQPLNEAVGPFTTSSEAYESAIAAQTRPA